MPVITALYGGLCGILVIVLSLRVVAFRRGNKVGLGSGGDRAGEIRIRAHANAVEYIPLGLLLLLVAELCGVSAGWLYPLGALFVLGRLMHPIGLAAGGGGYHFARFWGSLISWLAILALAVIDMAVALTGI